MEELRKKKKKAKRKQSCLHKQTKKNLNNEHNTNLLYDMSFLNLGISQLDLKAKTLQPSHKKIAFISFWSPVNKLVDISSAISVSFF